MEPLSQFLARLEAENKIMKSKLEEAEKKADATTNPLVEQLEVAKKRTGEVESELKQLKGKADEWKSMYEACKFKEDDIKKWEVQQAELKSKLTSLEEKIGSLQGKLEEEQKICKEEKSKVQDLTKVRDELQGTLKAKEADFNKQASALKAVQGIKELHTRRLHELEALCKWDPPRCSWAAAKMVINHEHHMTYWCLVGNGGMG
eukprot:s3976_g1.t1